MLVAIAAHFLAALVAPMLVKHLGRKAFIPLSLVPAASALYLLTKAPHDLATAPLETVVPWIPQFGMNVALRLDPLAWLFAMIATVMGAVIMLYCWRYFKDSEPSLGRFAAVFTAFAGAMLGLVLSDDVMLLFIFWELTTIFSYLLIGHYVTKQASRRAAMNALISTTIGGLAMMVGLLMIGALAGSMRISEITESQEFAQVTPFAVVALVLVAMGAATKSALVPGHFWLPGAMAAPTPVSAYLHAAAMVKAGIYLLLRFAPLFAQVEALAATIAIVGVATMILGGWRALRQFDIKLLLAYGTVSQLGFMAAIAVSATADAVFATSALVLSHALFKAPLFMVVGIIDKSYGTRDIRTLQGVGREMPVVAAVAILSAASMAAIPPLFGFIAKEAVFHALATGSTWQQVVFVGAVLGSILTVAYSARFVLRTFPGRGGLPHKHPSAPFQAGPAFIAALALAAIPLTHPIDEFVQLIGEDAAHRTALISGGEVEHAHGALHIIPTEFSAALAGSLIALAVGALLALAARHVERFQAAVSPKEHWWGYYLDAERGFRALMREIDFVAVQSTAFFQRGSLPLNLGAIFATFVLMLGSVALLIPGLPHTLVPFHHPAEVAVAGAAILGALGAARARRRLRAALLLSSTGFAVALLFMLYGAPDVAATQLFVETMMTVVLVLVLRRLPAHFSIRPSTWTQVNRWGIAILTAITTVLIFAYAAAARIQAPLGPDLIEAGYEIGKGHNAVNVALVDARVWDTTGEISVLLVVATGVASLIFVMKRELSIVRVADLSEDTSIWRRKDFGNLPHNTLAFDADGGELEGNRGLTWLSGSKTLAPERRMVILEVITRIAFPLLILLSLYLLLAGHNYPGGGFAGGLVAGLALTLRYLAGGRYELNEAAPYQAGALLGGGLVIAILTGIVPLFVGGTIFQSYVWIGHVPFFGEVELASALAFDIGVYLLVVGLVLDFLRTLGEQIDRHQEAELDAR